MARLFSSPGLNFRKKPAGRDIRRIIMDACTPREVFISSLLWTKPLTLPRSCDERDTQIMQMAIPIRAFARPLESTGPVSARVMRGMMSPTSVTAKVADAIMTISLILTQCFM